MPCIGLLEIKLSVYISIVLIKYFHKICVISLSRKLITHIAIMYMNLPIGVVGLTTGVLLFVRDAVLVTLL